MTSMPESNTPKISIEDAMHSAMRNAMASVLEQLPDDVRIANISDHIDGDYEAEIEQILTVGDIDLDALRDAPKKKRGRPRKKKSSKKKASKKKSTRRMRPPRVAASKDEEEQTDDGEAEAESGDTNGHETLDHKILAAINDDGPLSTDQIAESIGENKKDVSNIVMAMFNDDKLVATRKRGKMCYSIK